MFESCSCSPEIDQLALLIGGQLICVPADLVLAVTSTSAGLDGTWSWSASLAVPTVSDAERLPAENAISCVGAAATGVCSEPLLSLTVPLELRKTAETSTGGTGPLNRKPVPASVWVSVGWSGSDSGGGWGLPTDDDDATSWCSTGGTREPSTNCP